MAEIIITTVLLVMAALSAFVLMLGLVGGVQVASKVRNGILQYFFIVLMFSNGAAWLITSRVADDALDLSTPPDPSFLGTWLIRLTSIFAIVGCADQFIRYWRDSTRIQASRVLLIIAIILVFTGTILVPSRFGAYTSPLQLSWFYAPAVCVGLLCLNAQAADHALEICRNSLVAFCVVSLMMIPVIPDVVLQRSYTQGFLPGVPRFLGLAPHAIMMGMLASVACWCLISRPFASRVIQRLAMGVCLLALFLAQAKTNWITFALGFIVLHFYRLDTRGWQFKSLGKLNAFYALAALAVVAFMSLGLAALLTGAASDRLEHFSRSSAGQQMLTVTGRDVIWRHALDEWRTSPWTGYGLPLFSPEYRLQIHFSAATSGHNQFIDALGRAGIIGFVPIAFYYVLLLWFGFKYGRATKGLSAVLAMALLLRSISEIPIRIQNISAGEVPHYVLLILIGGCLWSERNKFAKNKSAGKLLPT